MNNRKSVPTIDGIEFVNLQTMDISPKLSACDIKVLYVGQNRNGSFINKEAATKMSKTLRGCPIVGWYIEEKEDFGDHGDQLVIDGNGVQFNKLTRPYGFIPLDAKIWFQWFEDTDEFGNTCMREYLCVKGVLWTGQFAEAQTALDNHDPQSMELDPDSLQGHWATDNNSGLEFFIINDAIFSALCILGEDVEPCFEGANVTPSEISSLFTKESNEQGKQFLQDLFTMMQEVNYALNKNEGGPSMEEQKTTAVEPEVQAEQQVAENSLNGSEEVVVQPESQEVVSSSGEEFENKEKDDDNNDPNKEEEEKKPQTKNSLEEENNNFELLQKSFNELQEKFVLLEQENAALINFRNAVENKQKDDLIASFYMLSDEDKKAVIENKANYTLEEIKKELSVICFDKKVDFNAAEKNEQIEDTNDQTPPTVFNLNALNTEADNIPAWLKRVDEVKNLNN